MGWLTMRKGKEEEMMKKSRVLTTVLTAGVLAGVLSGCGSLSLNLGDEADRMKNYVQGYLDLTYKGQCNDDYLQEMDLTEEEAQEQYEQSIQVEVEFFQNNIGLFDYPSEETTQKLTQLYKEIYSHSDYTVVSSSKLDSGNYVVEVTVRPIDIMTNFTSDDFQAIFETVLADMGVTTQEQLDAMSEEDYQKADQLYAQQVVQMLEEKMGSIGNGEEKSLTVQIEDDGDMWSPSQDDFDAINLAIIDYSNFGF